jgi:hypothetical protein
MILDDLNVPGFAIAPNKTYPPLIVNANAALCACVSRGEETAFVVAAHMVVSNAPTEIG